MSNTLSINGVTAEQVYQTVLKTGAADSDAKLLVSNWLYQGYLRQGRSFAYATPFPASVPDCVPAPFQRTFAHRDWVDGEDLVQAGTTAEDDGFNARFHRIEDDLDALGSRVAQLADCLADLRASLHHVLDEIAAELNRIDNDIAPVRSVIVDPVFSGNLPVAATPGPTVRPPLLVDDPGYKYLGTTVFQDKQVSLFDSSKGVVILPSVDASVATVTQQVAATGALAQAMQDNADLKAAAGGALTKEDMVQKFGNVVLANGQTVQQAVAILPDGAQYADGQAMLDDLATHTTAVLQTTDGAAAQLATTVDAPATAATLGGADVAGLGTLTPDATKALRDAGITTIGQLSSADPGKVTEILSSGTKGLTDGQIASVRTTAKTLSGVAIRR